MDYQGREFSPVQLVVSALLFVGGCGFAIWSASAGVTAAAGLVACVAYIALSMSIAEGLNVALVARGRKPRPFMLLHVMVMTLWLFAAYHMLATRVDVAVVLGLMLASLAFYVAFFVIGVVTTSLLLPSVVFELAGAAAGWVIKGFRAHKR